jgi:hypothetical protein
MRWTSVIDVQDEREWFEDYVRVALATPAPSLPPQSQRVGVSSATWFETEPGVAFIHTAGGSIDDRALAERVVREQLRGHGYKQASYTFDHDEPFRKTADWNDIMAKAKRLIQSGQVQLLRNGYNNVVGFVKGDHGEYQTEISREDPTSRAITQWQCECPWDQYAFQRTRQWKKYEGRPCAHVLATYWKALSAPIDEDVHPAQGQQEQLFQPQGIGAPAPRPVPFAAPQPAPQGVQMQIPGMFPGQATGTPPMPGGQPPDVIPPFPLDQIQQAPQVNPASVPGLRQPSPTNPVQYPGGTFSAVQSSYSDTLTQDWAFNVPHKEHYAAQPEGFVNGNMVSTKVDDWGTYVGRSEEHGAGQPAKIPAGSVGEVLGQDPTGMVNVLFENKITENMGKLEPNGVVAWFFPSELALRPDVRRPGPAVRRR